MQSVKKRLHLEADSESSALQLATVHHRMGKINRAISVLKVSASLDAFVVTDFSSGTNKHRK